LLKFVVRRLLQLIPILFGVSILVFLWVRALPGGPGEALLGERATEEQVRAVEEAYGLDRPVYEQYISYLDQVVHLDFGQSIRQRRDVTEEIRRRFPATIELTVAAMILAVGIGVPLGFLAAKRYLRPVDHASMIGSLIGISVPVFLLGLILKYIFGERLKILPTFGRLSPETSSEHPTNFFVLDALVTGNGEAFWDALKHLVLPAVALATIPLALITRITRAAVLEVQNEDYVRTADAKGLTGGVVNRRHVLRNAMLPLVTVIGLQTGLLLSGAVLTETVFRWNGMGQFMSDAVFYRDYPVLQGGILFLAIIFVLVNLVVDLAYGLLDPRIRVR
jgi:peptide/nickel transport system permease protein